MSNHHAVLKVPAQYTTIQSALNAAHTGDTVVIAKGTYVEQLTITTSVTIRGAGVGKTIIQSPATVAPDPFGNSWTIEIGNAATVTMSGFTLELTPQCIVFPGPSHPYTDYPFAGGGIGVGGSAFLTLRSALVTTNGASEGDPCGGPDVSTAGFESFGTGVDFGLDYLGGLPATTALVGFGSVTQSVVSGFGFLGSCIAVGGMADSPAGSSAYIANDNLSTAADAGGLIAALTVGGGANASSAVIVRNSFVTSSPNGPNAITVLDNNTTAQIQYNSILLGPGGLGILGAQGAALTILHNVILGPTNDYAFGAVALDFGASATVSYNVIGQIECAYSSVLSGLGLCGPSYTTQYQLSGIFNLNYYGTGTIVETYNLIYNTDAGVSDVGGCSTCVVSGNVILNSSDYGLEAVDGNSSFGPNLIIGGAYGVGSIAANVNTTVTLTGVVILHPAAATFYYEVDLPGGTATIVGT